jgi:hypothetical protein
MIFLLTSVAAKVYDYRLPPSLEYFSTEPIWRLESCDQPLPKTNPHAEFTLYISPENCVDSSLLKLLVCLYIYCRVQITQWKMLTEPHSCTI